MVNAQAIQTLLLLLLAFVGWPGGLRGQTAQTPPEADGADEFLVQNWQTDQGLPRNTISALAQDYQGYLWMGTPQGLIRFDGVRFVALEGETSPTLARGAVQKIFPDNSGRLWIATHRSGLFCYADGGISQVASSNLPPGVAVDSVAQDGTGRLWATRGDGLLGCLQGDSFVPAAWLGRITRGLMWFSLTTDTDGNLWFAKQDTYGRIIDGQPTNWTTRADSVITLAPRRAGGLWVSTGYDVRKLEPGQASAETVVATLPSGPYGVNVMYEDHAGTLWLGMENQGLLRLKDGVLEPVKGVNHPVRALLEDAEGNLWVGTDGAGLFRIRPRVFQVTGRNDGLPAEAVVSVSGDWVAPRGGGLGKLLGNGRVAMVDAFKQNGVSAVLDDGAGGVWAGTAGGRVIHQSASGQRQTTQLWHDGPQVRVLHRDQLGNVWAGGFPSGLFRFSAGDDLHWQDLSWHGFKNDSVTAIAGDATGGIWIGTSAGELFECQSNVFRKYGAAAGFRGFPIVALLPGADASLWVGTLGGGLGRFQHGRVRFLGVAAGLTDTVITQLIEDQAGWMWVGSSRGICRVRTAELVAALAGRIPTANAVQFGPADGLVNVECVAEHQPSVCRTPAGWIRFATSKGVISFDPAAIPVNYRPPPLILERVLVDGRSVPPTAELKLPHDYEKIEFHYTATSLIAPEEVRFKRRLLGFDEGWMEDGTVRRATYPRLAPGRYEFQFTARNHDGVWNDAPCQFAFEVVPAFWQTTWFRAGAVILFTGLVGGVVLAIARLRMRRRLARLEQANALERERSRISRDLHDDLGARLTQMALLTDLAADDPLTSSVEVKSQIKNVSALARTAVQSLDETVWMLNPQKDTLAHVIEYVAQYAEQFFQATPIHCRQEICRQPPAWVMPGKLRRDILMLVKEALNNVLKHSQASEVWLRIAVRGRLMRITVQDNGRGFEVSIPSARHGLDNMRRRGAAAGIKVSVRSQIGRGTRVALRVKLPAAPAADASRGGVEGVLPAG
jgi:signal transduction histidine kinase/ligand-binding sensor domain-containing protein